MCESLAANLLELYQQTVYGKDDNFVFASPTLKGKQPFVGADRERPVRQTSRNRLGTGK